MKFQYMGSGWSDVPGIKLEILTHGRPIYIRWGLRLGGNHTRLTSEARILIDGKDYTKYKCLSGEPSNIKQNGVPGDSNLKRTVQHVKEFFFVEIPAGTHEIKMQKKIGLNTDFWWLSFDPFIHVAEL